MLPFPTPPAGVSALTTPDQPLTATLIGNGFLPRVVPSVSTGVLTLASTPILALVAEGRAEGLTWGITGALVHCRLGLGLGLGALVHCRPLALTYIRISYELT